MIAFPRLKTFLSVFPISETAWGLRGGADELWRIKLADERSIRAFSALLPYLNGRTATEDILRALERAGTHRAAATAVLRQLEASSLIEEADVSGLSDSELDRFEDQIRFFSRFTQKGGATFQSALLQSRVALIGDGALGERMYGQLAGAGFGEVIVLSAQPAEARAWIDRVSGARPRTTVLDLDRDGIWPTDAGSLPAVLAVCQDTHDPLLLEAVDRLSKRRRLPWLLVRNLDLQEGWVGPLFVPGETASYLSLEARLRSNMSRYTEYLAFDAHVRTTERPPTTGGLHAAFDLLASLAAIELIKFVTQIKVPELLGKFVTVNFWTWETELHEVLRMPALDRTEAASPVVFPWKVSHDNGAALSSRA
jgi:bacteriocin biosynthesis cyclodehydratase domain-containing protein